MKVGLIMRRALDDLLVEDDIQWRTYGQFKYLQNQGYDVTSFTPDNLNIEKLKKNDVVFYFHYPFNLELSKYLMQYENDVLFINPPSKVLQSSPKTFENDFFPEFLPASILYRTVGDSELYSFLSKNPKVVAKPVDGTGGEGIHLLSEQMTVQDKASLVKDLDSSNAMGYIVQEFINNKGDKRVMIFDGEILGSAARYNPKHFVNNIRSGASYISLPLSEKEVEMSKNIAARLKSMEITFAGLDLVADKLLEINTSAPGTIPIIKPVSGDYNVLDRFNDLLVGFYENKRR